MAALCAQVSSQVLGPMSMPAQNQNTVMTGSLQINYPGREEIYVEINGFQCFSEYVAGSLLLSNLVPGEYMLRITTRQGRYGGAEYYNGRIAVRQSQKVVVAVGGRGISSVSYVADHNSVALNLNTGGFPVGGRDNYGRNPYGESGRDQLMSDGEFARFIADIKNARFDDDKLKIVGIAAVYNVFTTTQVASMLNCFSFDDNKLKCAEMLRGRITDMRNVHVLSSCFTFRSSRDRLYEIFR